MGPLERFARGFLLPRRKASKDEAEELSNAFSATSLVSPSSSRQQQQRHRSNNPQASSSHARHHHQQAVSSASAHASRPLPRPPLLLSYERNGGQDSARPTSERLMPMPMPMPIPQHDWTPPPTKQAHGLPSSIPFHHEGRYPNPWELPLRQGASISPSPTSIPAEAAASTPRTPKPRAKAKSSGQTLSSGKRKEAASEGRDKARSTKPSKDIVTDPNIAPGLGQCWGIKKDGTRCTRRLSSSLPSSSSPVKAGREGTPTKKGDVIVVDDSDSSLSPGEESDDDDVRRDYCFQHAKEINRTNGFLLPGRRRRRQQPHHHRHDHSQRPRKESTTSLSASSSAEDSNGSSIQDETYIDFDDYLSPGGNSGRELSDRAKARLRTAMCRSPSKVDWKQRGYIYIYELRDRSTATHLALKVGRAVNVFKRIEQWRSRCQSKDPLLRAFFPQLERRPRPVAAAAEALSSDDEEEQQGLMPGADAAKIQGMFLAHKWEHLCHLELEDLGTRLDEGQPCKDCGSRHREIFLVPRTKVLGYEGVRGIVEKWARFVRLVERSRRS